MKTKDQISKIKTVVAYILKKVPQGLDYIHLFKIMYFAQQEHLVVWGAPIMDDSFVARRHGAVPTLTYKVIKSVENGREVSEDLKDFYNTISITTDEDHQLIKLSNGAECDMDELSESDTEILDKWITNCMDINSYKLSDLSHDKAWKQAKRQTDKTGEDTKITLYAMAKAGGAPDGMLEVIKERQFIQRALSDGF
ncbi:MAG: SocA family protein [Bacteroidales bacterium]|nr:SocA family protein [Bacteroidales bacterium]